mgnify:FL=1
MEAGKSYEFTTDFNIDNVTDEDDKPNPIEFTVTVVTGWGEFTDQAVTLPEAQAPAAE